MKHQKEKKLVLMFMMKKVSPFLTPPHPPLHFPLPPFPSFLLPLLLPPLPPPISYLRSLSSLPLASLHQL